jgi:hypothetical protein
MWRRSPTLRSSAAALGVLAFAAGCGSNPTSRVVSVTGRVGPLQVDRSDRAAVIRFAGRPAAELLGQSLNYAPYRALGYGCAATGSRNTVELRARGPYCRTAFFLERRTGRLGLFFTTAPAYSESHGIRIGTPQRRAERLLHQRLVVGCLAALRLSSPKASLSISFRGGIEEGTAIRAAHVDAFVLHGNGDDLGIFDCL